MLREYSHDQKFCFLPQKSFMSETGRSQGNDEKASKSVSPSTIVVDLILFFPIPSTYSGMKTP